MRRPVRLAAVALAVLIGLLGACSSAQSAPDQAAAGDPAGAFSVTVEHKFGSITLDSRPERVVSIGYKEQDWLYQFGVSPVAVREWYGIYDHEINPWAADLVDGEPPVVLRGELNLEKIAALEPDLIVGIYSGISAEEYQTLSKIAPVLAGPVGSTDYKEPWREMTRLIGASLGQPERADKIIADVEAQFEAAKQQHPEFVGAEVITAAAWSSDSLGIYTAGDPRAQLLAELGLVTPPEVGELNDDGEFWVPVSAELVDETFDLADDAVIVIGAPLGADEPGARDTLGDNPTFVRSRVTQEGRVVFLDTVASDLAYSFGSPRSISFTLEHLVPQLAAAIDGDPQTPVPDAPA